MSNSNISHNNNEWGGNYSRIALLILRALQKHGASTRRRLSKLTQVEIGSLCNPLNRLENPKPPKRPIVKSYDAPCPVTGQQVKHYYLTNESSMALAQPSLQSNLPTPAL
jgi:hypothetical protein